MKTNNLRLSVDEKISLINNMSTMLAAGIPILEAVESLLEDAKGNQKKVIEAFVEDLGQGKRIHTTLARFPKAFDSVTVNLVKASEEAGTLDTTLADLGEKIRRESEFSDKVKSALTYPVFVIVVFFAVLILMLTFVIPRISSVFSRLDVDLPLPTMVLMVASDFVLENAILVIVGSLLFLVSLFFLYRVKQEFITNLLFSLPVISSLMRQIDITRFSRSFSLLLASGISITNALELSVEVVNKKEIKSAIQDAHDEVVSGHNLSGAFRKHKNIFPTIIIKMTEAGEKTGGLEKSMQDISTHMDYQVSKSLKEFTNLLEPIMLVFIGTLIGGMMLAIIAPIYNLIGQVAAR